MSDEAKPAKPVKPATSPPAPVAIPADLADQVSKTFAGLSPEQIAKAKHELNLGDHTIHVVQRLTPAKQLRWLSVVNTILGRK